MPSFNRFGTKLSTSVWQVKLSPEEVDAIESDGFSIRTNVPALYWPETRVVPSQLLVLKQRWENYSHLL